jgi:hypothetical protein
MKWAHDYKRDVLHPNKTQSRTCTCLHDGVDGLQFLNNVNINKNNVLLTQAKVTLVDFGCPV